MSIPYWPGDGANLTFQQLSYNPASNSLSLVPFGNTVNLSTVSVGPSGGSIVTSIPNSSNAYIQYFTGSNNSQFINQIHFNQATSSISLVAGPGESIGVGDGGIGFNPGSNQPITIFNGYLDLNNFGMSNVSSINSISLPTTRVIGFGSGFIPGSNPFVVTSNASQFPIATFSNLTPGRFYRCSFDASFANFTNSNASSNSYMTLTGFGVGSPSDAESIASINALSWVQQPGNVPGYLGAAAAAYGCLFNPGSNTWTVYANSFTNVDYTMFVGKIYLEQLL